LILGEVAFLEVTACTDFGAFVDFGLSRQLRVLFVVSAESGERIRIITAPFHEREHLIGVLHEGHVA